MESERVTASGLVYLFGDQFVSLAGSAFLGGQTRLAHRGRTVQTESLAYKLFEAAFVSLEAQGYISLEMEKTDLPVSLARPRVSAFPHSQGSDLPPSLERATMGALSGAPESDPIPDVVVRVIQKTSRRPSRSSRLVIAADVIQRCECVVDYVRRPLADAGYLHPRAAEERPPGPLAAQALGYKSAIEPLAVEAGTLRSALDTFASTNEKLRTRLVEEIAAGFMYSPPAPLKPADVLFFLLGLLGLWFDSE